MEKIGKASKAVVADSASTKSGSVLQTKTERGTLPPAFVPETDRTIPDQTWSAWKPKGDEARTIRRELQPDERRKLQHRAASLQPHLKGFDRPTEDGIVAAALAKMFGGFTTYRGEGDQAIAKLRSTMDTIEVFPAWAIVEACEEIKEKGYDAFRDGEVVRERQWAPSDPDLYRVIAAKQQLRLDALRNAEQLLAAKVESAIEESPEQKAAAVARWQEQKAKMIGADQLGALQAEAAEKRRIATVERNKTIVADSYRIAGVDMPEGTTSTFQMMLAMGWTVETVGGRKVLVSAPPGWRREMTR